MNCSLEVHALTYICGVKVLDLLDECMLEEEGWLA